MKKNSNLGKEIARWIKVQVKQAKAKGIVLGLSGGIDSACVAVLSKMAVGKNVLGLIMSCQSAPEDEEYAYLLAEKFNIKTERVALDSVYDSFLRILPSGNKLMLSNLKPRLRMVALYAFANKYNYLVAGTGNKSELTVGYFTKYGDGGVDLLPLGDLLKTRVRKLAKELNIPDEIIQRVPSAGLWKGQTDEGELGISYENLDKAIAAIEKKTKVKVASGIIGKVRRLNLASEHKRLSIPIFKRR